MNLHSYLTRLYSTITSRQEIRIESLEIEYIVTGEASFTAVLQFFDKSSLIIEEEIEEQFDQTVNKLRYKYHYQDASNTLIFRYDNVPHHPSIKTFPHHKHEGTRILPSEPIDLSLILQEIDQYLYN